MLDTRIGLNLSKGSVYVISHFKSYAFLQEFLVAYTTYKILVWMGYNISIKMLLSHQASLNFVPQYKSSSSTFFFYKAVTERYALNILSEELS